MLWQDELGDDFLLLKYAEVYEYFDNTLRLLVFCPQKCSQLRKSGLILNEDSTDDGLCIVDVDKQNLEQIIALGAFKRRPSIKGKWIKDKEKKLAHRIITFNPKIKERNNNGIL